MSPETPPAIITPSCSENTSQEQQDKEREESQQLQLTTSFSPSVLAGEHEARLEYQDCDEDSEAVSRDTGSVPPTPGYDASSGAPPQCDQVLKPTSQASSSSIQNYDLCSSDENFCYAHRMLLSESMSTSGSGGGSTNTANSSTFLTGSFVNMYHDSDYVNPHQKPEEVLHWYRTERVCGEQDDWEVVEVRLDGAMDGAADTKTLEVVDYHVTKAPGEENQIWEMPQRVVREVVGDEVLARTDLTVGWEGVVDYEDSNPGEG